MAFDPEGFAQRQLDAYNARDLDRFTLDQEYVTGVPGAPLEVAAIYEVTERGISRVWFLGSK
jgi:hypothetical protein